MTYYRNYQDGGKVEPGFIKRWFADKYKASSDQIGGLASQIATIESDNMNVPQMEGGPGRGYFQFETKKGSGAFQTALQRAKNIYKASGKRIPQWISDAKKSDDATTLNREQQEELLLANFAENPRAKKEMIMGALESGDAKDLWLQAHWAGKKEQYEEKSKYWDKKFQGMADGGEVIEQNTDTVPAMLTPGEFVIRKDAADQIGPEKLNMLNNIDRLSNTALLENAKSPMGYQKGGLVGMLGDFISGQKENWARAKTMEEETGVRNPFLKTEEEQLAQMQKTGSVPKGGWLEKKLANLYTSEDEMGQMMGEGEYNIPPVAAPAVSTEASIPVSEPPSANPAVSGPSASIPKKQSWFSRLFGGDEGSGTVWEQRGLGLGPTESAIKLPTEEAVPEEPKYTHDEQMKFKDHLRRTLGTEDVYEFMKGRHGVDIASEEYDIEGKEKTDWAKVLGKITKLSMEEDIKDVGITGPVVAKTGSPLYDKWLQSVWDSRGRHSQGATAQVYPEGHEYEGLEYMTVPGFKQEGGYIHGYQEGGEVMNYQNGGQMNDVLSIFGEKSKQGDEMQKLMAMAAMQQMQRAQQVQQAIGMQGGGYADEYQQGGTVEPPMSGPESGPQEAPLPGGDQTYYKPPMEQLDMDQFEYASYVEHGPDMYKWMAPKYKSKQQWTPYDAMVDAGTIDPYEIGKDELNVVTNDQLEALSNQARESMRV